MLEFARNPVAKPSNLTYRSAAVGLSLEIKSPISTRSASA